LVDICSLSFREISRKSNFEYLGVKTPNIDKLSKQGTNLSGMYTATPMCMPNRQAFLTMRMNSVNGSHSNGVALDLDSNTFPELLRAAGYKTA